jgi:hypothetical protein
MNKEDTIRIGKHILQTATNNEIEGIASQAKELINAFYGKNNAFYSSLNQIDATTPTRIMFDRTFSNLRKFIESIELGIIGTPSYENSIKQSVVNDYMNQAEALLANKTIHPATAAMLIGASLEEFLRNWVEKEGLSDTVESNSIDGYAKRLKAEGFIEKQDYKEITSWAGLRNDAAHGYWEKVASKEKIEIMLKSVSLFMAKQNV